MKELQSKLDKMPYPPTENYKIDGLVPDKFLAERIKIINNSCPDFFEGTNFLDIGFGKGFFTFYASKGFNQVVGIEPRLNYFDFCQEAIKVLNLKNIKLECCSFKNFYPTKLFDRVFIGNYMHYIYQARDSKENDGWLWVNKLASLVDSNGIVFIEAPLDGKENLDIKYLAEDKEYNKQTFLKKISPFFEVMSITKSYSKYRYVIVLKRKINALQNVYDLNKVKKIKILDKRLDRNVFVADDGNVYKIFPVVTSLQFLISFVTVSYLPTREEIKGVIKSNDKIIGFVQDYLKPSEISKKEFINFAWDIFKKDQEMLSKIGYIDIDAGIVNFIYSNNQIKNVDMGGVIPNINISEKGQDCYRRTLMRDYLSFIDKKEIEFEIKKMEELI